jgi:hypothetical protein
MEMKYMNNDKQHREDTKYKQWQDGMYVMLDDLADPPDLQGYILAVVENSLRDSLYFDDACYFGVTRNDNCLGVLDGDSGTWSSASRLPLKTKLTRSQALYIATGDADI